MKNGFLLKKEEDLAGFLGIQIKHNKQNNKTILAQTGPIDQILEAMHTTDYNPKYTPTDKILSIKI